MSLYKVEICGVNTSKLPILTNAEKEELFDRIDKGDKEARELFINGNLRLVLSIIQRFSNSSENVDDLFQIGCIGLINACGHDAPFRKDKAYHRPSQRQSLPVRDRDPLHPVGTESGIHQTY